MGHDVWSLAEDFRKKNSFVKDINNTMLTLILKKIECKSMKNYKPISLCDTIYKIISKAIANRLKKILGHIVLEN